MSINKIITMSIVVMVAATVVREVNGNGTFDTFDTFSEEICISIVTIIIINLIGAACQLYGHSCLGGHGKRSSAPSYGPQDTDAAVDAAAIAAFQAKMSANKLNNILRDILARKMASASDAVPDMDTGINRR